ncbi:MAG: hypothetical protein HY585_02740 [Candidatus Omnitrophica bacterium]|nr:hypothetical protein [Candidatus Omnitrophota bacterium]
MKIHVPDFNLEATLDSGQVFGFTKLENRTYEGVIRNALVHLSQRDGCLTVDVKEGKLSEAAVQNFFDLNHNLSALYEILGTDTRLARAYQAFKGLRIVRQDPWEALACFIISSNNNIKRIQKIRANLSRTFSVSALAFPKPEAIADRNEEALRKLGLGYRAPFLLEAAKKVARGQLSSNQIQKMNYTESKAELMRFLGVGEKVADCTLLFGFQKYEAFPVDVWIHRVMKKLYFRNRRVSERKVQEFSRKRWGQAAGYVQQYLYHGAKSGIFEL